MFSKKPNIDVKKSTQKFLDGKRDFPTRLRHLKIVLGKFLYLLRFIDLKVVLMIFSYTDHVDTSEAKSILEAYFSPVFQIFYDSFALTESTLKQKSITAF